MATKKKAKRERLLLRNTHHTDVVVTLMKFRDVRASGAKRGRVQPLDVHLKRGCSVELCDLLQMSRDDVCAVLMGSPDFRKMEGHMLRVLDPDDTDGARQKAQLEAERRREVEEQQRAVLEKARADALLAHEMKKLAEKERQEAEERALREQEMSSLSVPVAPGADAIESLPEGDDPFKIEEATDAPVPTEALEPGMRAQLADSIPSTRWTLEQLQEHAASKGIEVDGLSKNAILRKLRGA